MKLKFTKINVPLRISFKHASHDRNEGSSLWTEASQGPHLGLGEGCPRQYVTGESQESALTWLNTQTPQLEKIADLKDFDDYKRLHEAQIDQNLSAFCSFELAFLDLLARQRAQSVEELLGIPCLDQAIFKYTAVLGDSSQQVFESTMQKYFSMGFWDYKLKVSGDLQRDRGRLLWIKRQAPPALQPQIRLRIDANNLWTSVEEALQYLNELGIPLLGVEEPLASKDKRALSRLSLESGNTIILDECLLTKEDVKQVAQLPGKWIGNIRVSKNGGVLRSLEIGRSLIQNKLGVILGAQVGESSILTRAAMSVSLALGQNVIAQEGAYGELLLEQDPVVPSIRFGAQGILDVNKFNQTAEVQIGNHGWGLIPNTHNRD